MLLAPVLVNPSASGLKGISTDGTSIHIDVSQAGVQKGKEVTSFAAFWNKVFDIVRYFITGITGILCIATVGVFAVKAFQLAKAGNNPKEKQEAMTGMLYAFIGAALLGGSSLLSALAFGLLKM